MDSNGSNRPVNRKPDDVYPLIRKNLGKLTNKAPLAKLENFDDLDDKSKNSEQTIINDGFVQNLPNSTKSRDDVDGQHQHHLPPYNMGFVPGEGGMELEPIPDVNIYQQKKTVAQGMMDLALFSANANQLRYVLENPKHPYYYPGIILILISLIFQVLVGVGLILNAQYDVKDRKEICLANKINNFTIIGIFLVTAVNVFVSAFGVAAN